MNQFTASIWGDEGFSAILSMKSIPEIISIVARDTSPPLYNITEHIWFQIFGSSEVAIRSLSFLYYCTAIFFVYLIASYLWNKKTGIIATAVAFFNPFFFIYAFEGRMYSILALGVTASMYFFIRILFDKKPSNKILAGYIFSTAWALYSHHFAMFGLFVQGAWFLYLVIAYLLTKNDKRENKTRLLTLLKGFVITGILYAPWMIPLYNQTKMVGGGFWLGKPTLVDLRELAYNYLGQGIKHSFAPYALYATLAGLALRAWEKDIKKNIFLASWFVIPLVATWTISQVFTPIFYDRYLIIAIPAGMILLASGRRKMVSNIVIAIAIGLYLLIDVNYFTNPTKRPFREFAQVVKQNQMPGDYLINWNSASHHLWETKYYGIGGPIYIEGSGELPFFVGTALMGENDIIRAIPDNINRVGAITSGDPSEVQIDGFTFDDEQQVGDLKVVWLTKNKLY